MALVLRLTRRAEFLRAARTGRKWAMPGLVLQAVATPQPIRSETSARLGFTASRKVGGAVVRNRVKRRLRAAADLVIKDHAEAGYDYVLIGRAETAQRPFTALLQDLETALKRLGRFSTAGAAGKATALEPSGNGTPSS